MLMIKSHPALLELLATLFCSFAAYALLIGMYKNDFDLSKILFTYLLGVVGPFVAIISLWYAPVGLAILCFCFFASMKYLPIKFRIPTNVGLSLMWVFFGIACFTVAVGGA